MVDNVWGALAPLKEAIAIKPSKPSVESWIKPTTFVNTLDTPLAFGSLHLIEPKNVALTCRPFPIKMKTPGVLAGGTATATDVEGTTRFTSKCMCGFEASVPVAIIFRRNGLCEACHIKLIDHTLKGLLC